jgi:hypothetical protein
LSKDENLFHKIKYRGFPRNDGFAKYINLKEYENYLPNTSDRLNGVHSILPINSDLTDLTNILFDKYTFDVVRGDLIMFEGFFDKSKDRDHQRRCRSQCHSLFIFDGCKLLNLDYSNSLWTDYLSKEFTVINNKVPMDYWKDIGDYMWFDFSTVKDQCLSNIRHKDDKNETPMTSFVIDNYTYNLYLPCEYDDYECDYIYTTIDELKRVINRNKLVLLHFCDAKRINNTIDNIGICEEHHLYCDY